MTGKILKEFQFFGKKLVYRGFYDHWLQICCQICKIQKSRSNTANKFFLKTPSVLEKIGIYKGLFIFLTMLY